MAQMNFSTTSWGPTEAAPNQFEDELNTAFAGIDAALNQDPVSVTTTSTAVSSTLANGGSFTISGIGYIGNVLTFGSISYSDPQGNYISMIGPMTADIATGDISGSLSSLSVKLSGIEVSATGNLVFSPSGSTYGTLSTLTEKVSGWSVTFGGSISYVDDVLGGTVTSFSAVSPQGDSFYISGATIPAAQMDAADSLDDLLTQSYLQGDDVMTAGSKNDVFGGFAGNDTMNGAAGNDTMTGGSGNDTINGGTGIDTAVCSGNRSSYVVTKTATGLTVADNTGADGSDTLSGVERLQFADGKLAFDLDGGAGNTAEIIGAIFGKQYLQTKEYIGIGISLFDSGQTMEQVAQLALNAGLFQQLAGSSSNTDFVKFVYHNVAGVDPGASDLEYYMQLLDTGVFTQASLAVAAAVTSLNTSNIGLTGLAQTGIEFV